MTYAEKLRDPRWRAKRLTILARDRYTCQSCTVGYKIMEVHHEYYLPGLEPWEYPDSALVTLCPGCHKTEENGRKQAYVGLNRAIADAGFTREDILKLTNAFRQVTVKPMYSYLVASKIYRVIGDAWNEFINPFEGKTIDEKIEAASNHFLNKEEMNG